MERDGRDRDRRDRGGRDRDAIGRAQSARPRDELGRPLPYGATGVAPLAGAEFRTPVQTLADAQQLLDQGRPFQAHEVFEEAWKTRPASERPLWQGLAQLAVGLTHQLRGNPAGAATLAARGAHTISTAPSDLSHGVDIAALIAWATGNRTEAFPALIAPITG